VEQKAAFFRPHQRGQGIVDGKTINQINEFFEWFDERRAL